MLDRFSSGCKKASGYSLLLYSCQGGFGFVVLPAAETDAVLFSIGYCICGFGSWVCGIVGCDGCTVIGLIGVEFTVLTGIMPGTCGMCVT